MSGTRSLVIALLHGAGQLRSRNHSRNLQHCSAKSGVLLGDRHDDSNDDEQCTPEKDPLTHAPRQKHHVAFSSASAS